jgi:hypothetical protein
MEDCMLDCEMDRCMAGVDAPATALNERFIPPHSK